ncbi:hypothetical protein FQR65_LT12007 [Abscondita terminalis]|nr:hypothetical protein FQR65_LT12007 [Abscondita terminalis]
MSAKSQQQLKILIAKKEQYFSRIQRLYDCSKDTSTKDKLSHFQIRYQSLQTTKTDFMAVLDEINILEFHIDPDYVPTYEVLETFDEMIANIEAVAKRVVSDSQLKKKTPTATPIEAKYKSVSSWVSADVAFYEQCLGCSGDDLGCGTGFPFASRTNRSHVVLVLLVALSGTRGVGVVVICDEYSGEWTSQDKLSASSSSLVKLVQQHHSFQIYFDCRSG